MRVSKKAVRASEELERCLRELGELSSELREPQMKLVGALRQLEGPQAQRQLKGPGGGGGGGGIGDNENENNMEKIGDILGHRSPEGKQLLN